METDVYEDTLRCRLDAFDAEQQVRYQALRSRLEASVTEATDLEDGISLSFAPEPLLCLAVMEFVTLERLCCPFLRFGLELGPRGGPLVLRLTGPPGVKLVLSGNSLLSAAGTDSPGRK